MKQRLIWFNLRRDRTGNGLSNIKDTFAESLQLQMSILYLEGWSVGVMAGENIKKVLDASGPNQNVETTWNPKLKFT